MCIKKSKVNPFPSEGIIINEKFMKFKASEDLKVLNASKKLKASKNLNVSKTSNPFETPKLQSDTQLNAISTEQIKRKPSICHNNKVFTFDDNSQLNPLSLEQNKRKLSIICVNNELESISNVNDSYE